MHGLLEIVFLNRNNREAAARNNATDPGHSRQRRAEADLSEALANLHDFLTARGETSADEGESCLGKESCPPASSTRFPPDFSVIRHADEAWVLPLTSNGQTIAAKIIPPGTRRYGLHYILTGEEGLAIAASIEAAS